MFCEMCKEEPLRSVNVDRRKGVSENYQKKMIWSKVMALGKGKEQIHPFVKDRNGELKRIKTKVRNNAESITVIFQTLDMRGEMT